MGASQTLPFTKELNQYEIVSKSEELVITYLRHIQTDKEYMLREHTYNKLE